MKFLTKIAVCTLWVIESVAVSNPAKSQNTFPATGNVGIGVAAAAAKLDIRTDNVNDGLNISYTNGARFARLFGGTLGTGAYNGVTQVGDGGIIYGGAAVGSALGFVIAPWGNFTGGLRLAGNGVATVSVPINNEGFNIYRPFDGQFTKIVAGALTTGAYNAITQSGDGGIIYGGAAVGTAHGFVIAPWANATSGLRMDNQGRVAIGYTASQPAGYNLFVQSGILTEKVKVAVNGSGQWADYVFAKDYKLMPLAQVEQYIKTHQHLPNVPSATTMVKEGNDLGKTDAKLLEKIEELTLYLIEMKKVTDRLEAENTAMKSEISNLKSNQCKTN